LAEAMSFAQRAEIEQRSYARNSNSGSNSNSNNGFRNFNNFGCTGGNNGTGSGAAPMELSNMQTNEHNEIHGYGDVVYNGNNINGWDQSMQQQHEQVQNLNSIQRFPPRYNNTNFNSYRVPGLTKEQIENYKRTGSCFNCGQRGHMKNQCPTLQRQSNVNAPKKY
jgi:hypothetical protein